MNVVFWLLIVLLLVALWFLLSRFFKPLGKFFRNQLNITKHDINDDDKDE